MSDLTGSSPLTRGKRRDEAYLIHGMRLIPARAGKTWHPSGDASELPAHPRSRGENHLLTANQDGATGSSPLARGKQRRRQPPRSRRGLIPARAGKTVFHDALLRSRGAHPRSRGENKAYGGGVSEDKGSSPLARGKPSAGASTPGQVRLIPARAGKTDGGGLTAGAHSAHPRSRGENLHGAHGAPLGGGSSPLARGKPSVAVGDIKDVGLIPARAGKTYPHLSCSQSGSAHPRSRGENGSTSKRTTP